MKDIKKIKKEIKKHSIISFDVFDTLLIRPFARPIDLFQYIEEKYKIPGFKNERVIAEQKARIKYKNQEEITYNQIYEEILNKFKKIKKIEIETEYSLLICNPDVKPIYDFAISQKKEIIITSDIYLSEPFLKKVLQKNGYYRYKSIFSSADTLKTKNTGSIYKYLLIRYTDSKKIIHIGDNYQSDFINARKNGIDAIHIEKPIEKILREKNINDFYQKNIDNLNISIVLGVLQTFDLNNYNYWQKIGLIYAGPTINSYVNWINKQSIDDKIDNLIFVARDGYPIKKVFDILNKNKKIKTHYIYAPRKLNSICNLDYSKNENEIHYLKTIIEYFNPEIAISIDSIKEGEIFLKKHIQQYKTLSEQKKTDYKKYIETQHINGKRIGIVDTRTSFFSAQKLIKSVLKNKYIHGYYWDVINSSNTITKKNFSTFSNKSQNLTSWDIMELFMTSPEPPIKDIENNKILFNKVKKEEKIRIKTYNEIDYGVVMYNQKFKEIFKETDIESSSQTIIKWINLISLNPNKIDIKKFKKIKHSSDSNHNKYNTLINFEQNIVEEKLNKEDFNIKANINLILGNKNQILWLLLLNIFLSRIVIGKNRLKLHQNVWYLKKRLDLINNKLIQTTENTKELKKYNKLEKKWELNTFNKKNINNYNINSLDIGFIIPSPIKGSGGHRNIFRAISFLKKHGHKVTVYYTETDDNPEIVRNNVNNWFYNMSDIPFIKWKNKMGHHDIGISTFWKTAYSLRENMNKIKFPFYFVQDFEPMFYQMGSEYVLAENSYRLGFFHICSGPWCKDFLVKNYNAKADYFQFPIDKETYNTSRKRTKENINIIFFAKPEMPRRCYDIGIKALEYFHKLKPDIEIITFGSNCLDSKTIPFKTTNLGLLPTISDLADLYRNADLGLVFSTTNPSLVPYEMMSCGCPIADLDIDLALSKYGNSKNNVFLVNSLPEKMAEDLVRIFDNPKEIQKHQKCGKKFVDKEFPTEEEMGKIFERIIKENITSKK